MRNMNFSAIIIMSCACDIQIFSNFLFFFKGKLRELNLSNLMYLGGYPDNVYHPASGIYQGLDGAIQRVSLFSEPCIIIK